MPALFKNTVDTILRRESDNIDFLKAAPKVSKIWSYNSLKWTYKRTKKHRHDSDVSMVPEISHMSSDGAQS